MGDDARRTAPGCTGMPRRCSCWQAQRCRARRSARQALEGIASPGLLRAAGPGRAGPARGGAARACAPHAEEKAAARANPGAQPRAVCHLAGPARRRRARVELHHQPAHPRRHERPRAAGRRRLCLPARGVGPLHQHQRTHQDRDRREQRFPMPFRDAWSSAPRASAWTRPMSTA
jgi:hypothetical protein